MSERVQSLFKDFGYFGNDDGRRVFFDCVHVMIDQQNRVHLGFSVCGEREL